MFWRNEFISGGKEAEALFLRTTYNLPSVVDLAVECTFDSAKGDFDALATGRFPNEEKPSTLLLLSAGTNSSKEFCVSHVRLHDRLKNHVYGSLLVKMAIGVAHEHGENIAYFTNLGEDSPKVCASYGGMPQMEPSYLADAIDEEINRAGERGISCPAARGRLREIAKIARKNAFLGWRLLSQDPARVLTNGSERFTPFRHLIFPRFVVPGDDMVLFLGDESTQTVLRKRLGALPAFRPLEKGHPYNRIRDALIQAPAAVLDLKAA